MEASIQPCHRDDRSGMPVLVLSPRSWGDFSLLARRDKALAQGFKRLGYSPILRKAQWEDEVLEALAFYDPDLVFSTFAFLSGPGGRRRNLHECLERSGFPYVGSPPETLDLARSRPAMLGLWRRHGLPVPDYFALAVGRGGRNRESMVLPWPQTSPSS